MLSSATAWRYRLLMLAGLIICFVLNDFQQPSGQQAVLAGLPPFLILALPLFFLMRKKQADLSLRVRRATGLHLVRDLAIGFAVFVAVWTFLSGEALGVIAAKTLVALLSVLIGGVLCVYLSLINVDCKQQI